MHISTFFSGTSRKRSRLGKLALLLFVCASSCLFANFVFAQAPTPFVCQQGISYLTNTATSTNANTSLYQFDIQAGTTTPIADPILAGSTVDAIGYNPVDNFIWGSVTGTNTLIKIGSNGATQIYTVTGLPVGTYEAGDIDASGNLYLFSMAGTNIYKIDLTTTPLPTLVTTYSYAAASTLADFSVSADGSTLYGIRQSFGDLATITLSGSTATQTTTPLGLATGNLWNAFQDSGGNLYVQNRANGNVFLVSPPHYNFAQQIQTGSGNVFNSDGASCPSVSLMDPLTPFTCTTFQYQVTATSMGAGSTLWEYNPVLGTRTSLGLLPGYVNAIGYNAVDNFIWGWGEGNTIVKIDANANWVQYSIPNLPSPPTDYNTGTISPDGYLYLYSSSAARYYTIDLDPSRATYLQLVDPTAGFVLDSAAPFGNAISPTRDISDWVYNSIDGKIYAVTNGDAGNPYRLVIFDPLTGTSTISGTAISGGGFQTEGPEYGAAFFDNAGNFYIVANSTGHFFRVDTNTLTATRVSTAGTSVNFNDGAGCPAAPPIMTDLGDAPDSYGTLFNSNGPVHILTPNLTIGASIDSEDDGNPTATANGDDTTGTGDDENGLASIPPLAVTSTSYSLTVSVVNTTGTTAVLAGWVDFNANGIFDPGERTQVTVPNNATSVTLSWTGLTGIVSGTSFIRLRLATDPAAIAAATGAAGDGEVEDYMIEVALPVKLAWFNVMKENKTALISWATVEETNSDHFELERSVDLKVWETVGNLPASTESQVLIRYSFTDSNPGLGTVYYRLKMIDRDATYAFSQVRSLKFDSRDRLSSVFPNPASNTLYLSGSTNAAVTGVTLINASGKAVYTANSPFTGKINVEKLPVGAYVVKVTFADKQIITHRVVITR